MPGKKVILKSVKIMSDYKYIRMALMNLLSGIQMKGKDEMSELNFEELTSRILGFAIEVHRQL